ncbi:tyrosine/serine/threonine protein phosphatase [Tilletia horrida]|nr:tyrosine/serine/threonine protein phosphatase [Tilletia horrida]KAK0560668.1 tyrosine/serine/threonine protein phosphatase [Tilletia horrida]
MLATLSPSFTSATPTAPNPASTHHHSLPPTPTIALDLGSHSPRGRPGGHISSHHFFLTPTLPSARLNGSASRIGPGSPRSSTSSHLFPSRTGAGLLKRARSSSHSVTSPRLVPLPDQQENVRYQPRRPSSATRTAFCITADPSRARSPQSSSPERKRRASCDLDTPDSPPSASASQHSHSSRNASFSETFLRLRTNNLPPESFSEASSSAGSVSSLLFSQTLSDSPKRRKLELPAFVSSLATGEQTPDSASSSSATSVISYEDCFGAGNIDAGLALELNTDSNTSRLPAPRSQLANCITSAVSSPATPPVLDTTMTQPGDSALPSDNMSSASGSGQAPTRQSVQAITTSMPSMAPSTNIMPPTPDTSVPVGPEPVLLTGMPSASASRMNAVDGTLSLPPQPSSRKARPKRLNLVPPGSSHSARSRFGGGEGDSAGQDQGEDEDWDPKAASNKNGIRSVPVSPSLLIPSSHSSGSDATSAKLAARGLGLGGIVVSTPEPPLDPVKDLSSTLRGAPRRRPSMPFRTSAASAVSVASSSCSGGTGGGIAPVGRVQTGGVRPKLPLLSIQTDAQTLGPSSRIHSANSGGAVSAMEKGGAGAASSAAAASRVPEAYRDPSEHILSGKGSTMQHARSVYAAGPVEILPGLFLGDEHNARDAERLSELNITTILDVAKETTLPVAVDGEDSPDDGPANAQLKLDLVFAIPLRTPRRESSSARASVSGSSSSGEGATVVSGTTTYRSPELSFQPPPSAHPSSMGFFSPSSQKTPVTAYFTPPSTAYPRHLPKEVSDAAAPTPKKSNAPPPAVSDADKTPYLRNTLSTPNLNRQGSKSRANPGTVSRRNTKSNRRGGESDSPSSGSEDILMEDDEEERTSVSSKPTSPETTPEITGHRANSSSTSHSRREADEAAMDVDQEGGEADDDNTLRLHDHRGKSVWLPENAIALTIPPSPFSGRAKETRYIKLPWTHDETDLAASGGGFTQGCAIIADALGIPPRLTHNGGVRKNRIASNSASDNFVPRAPKLIRGGGEADSGKPREGVLVHCQCGVSRSATLVIAFVMQAAALVYDFEGLNSLTGMHDCYNLVKEKSASISPNCSLIYQLVEWERYLSKEASKLREASAKLSQGNAADAVGVRGWSSEVIGEEEWSRMRMEEERKEAAEEEAIRQARLEEALQAARRKVAEEAEAVNTAANHSSEHAAPTSGLGARRKKRAPVLSLVPKLDAPGHPGLKAALQLGKDETAISSAPPPVMSKNADVPTIPATPSFHRGLPPVPGTARFRPSGMDSDVSAPLTSAMPSLSLSATKEEDTDGDDDVSKTSTGTVDAFSLRLESKLKDLQATSEPRKSPRTPSIPPSFSVPGTSIALSRLTSVDGKSDPADTSVDAGHNKQTEGDVTVPAKTSTTLSRVSSHRTRPDADRRRSVQVVSGAGAAGPTSSFVGAAFQSPADRKERHRRTFSSDWPPPMLSREALTSLKAEVQAAAAKIEEQQS